MQVARTYFFSRMDGDELAGLCDAKEDFFLENIDDLELAVARLQAALGNAGMSSAVERAPLNPAPGVGDLVSLAAPLLGLIWSSTSALGSAARPQADATLRLTSNTSMSVMFSRGQRPPAAR